MAYREGAEGAELETLEFRNSNYDIWLFRVFCEEVFTAEAQSSQRSENFKLELFTPRPRRLRGAISESYFTGKPEDPESLRCELSLVSLCGGL